MLTADLVSTIIPASIAFIGVLLSVLLSYLVSVRKLKIENENLIESKKKTFSEVLQAERIKLYPGIYETISDFVKFYRVESKIPFEKLQELYRTISNFDSKYGLFFSTNTTYTSAQLLQEMRKAITTNADINDRAVVVSLFNFIGSFELSLKRDIGVFLIDTKDASKLKFDSYEGLLSEMGEKMIKTWDQ